MTRTTGFTPFGPGTPWDLFRFEAPEAGAPAAVVEPAAPAAGEGEPPAWAGPSQEEWEGLQQQSAALHQWAQQQAAREAQATQGERVRFDAFADDPDAVLRQIIREEMAPLQQTYQRIENAEGQELAYDVIDDNVAREGDFLHDGAKDLAFQLARGFLPAAVQKHGYGDRAAEAAIEMACAHVRQLEQTIGQTFYDRKTNELATLAGARREPGAGGPAAQVPTGAFKQGESVADRYFGG